MANVDRLSLCSLYIIVMIIVIMIITMLVGIIIMLVTIPWPFNFPKSV